MPPMLIRQTIGTNAPSGAEVVLNWTLWCSVMAVFKSCPALSMANTPR